MPRLLRVLTTLPQYALMRFAFYAARAHYCFPLPRSFNRQAPRRRISAMCISVFSADTENVIRPLPLGSPCFSARRTVLFFSPRRPRFFRVVRRAVSTFPLLRSAFYVSFAEDVYCCKKCGKKGRRKNTAPNGLPVIDIVMFHHCPFAASAMPLIFSFGKCKLFSSGKTHRSFVRFAFPAFLLRFPRFSFDTCDAGVQARQARRFICNAPLVAAYFPAALPLTFLRGAYRRLLSRSLAPHVFAECVAAAYFPAALPLTFLRRVRYAFLRS